MLLLESHFIKAAAKTLKVKCLGNICARFQLEVRRSKRIASNADIDFAAHLILRGMCQYIRARFIIKIALNKRMQLFFIFSNSI